MLDTKKTAMSKIRRIFLIHVPKFIIYGINAHKKINIILKNKFILLYYYVECNCLQNFLNFLLLMVVINFVSYRVAVKVFHQMCFESLGIKVFKRRLYKFREYEAVNQSSDN